MERLTYGQVFPAAKKERQIKTFTEFATTVRDTYCMARNVDGSHFIHGYPVQSNNVVEIDAPIITFRLVSKKVSKMGSLTPLKPALRATAVDPSNPQQAKTEFQLRYDYLLEFGFWSPNWELAEQLEDDFEDFIMTYTGLFKELGVRELVFQEAAQAKSNTDSWRTDLVSMNAWYLVQIDKILTINNQVIESIKSKFVGGEN